MEEYKPYIYYAFEHQIREWMPFTNKVQSVNFTTPKSYVWKYQNLEYSRISDTEITNISEN